MKARSGVWLHEQARFRSRRVAAARLCRLRARSRGGAARRYGLHRSGGAPSRRRRLRDQRRGRRARAPRREPRPAAFARGSARPRPGARVGVRGTCQGRGAHGHFARARDHRGAESARRSFDPGSALDRDTGARPRASAGTCHRQGAVDLARHPLLLREMRTRDQKRRGRLAARFPPGMWSCLAGFVEPGDTFEEAVRREMFEEAGIKTGRVAYYTSQPWPFPMSVMIGFHAEAETTDLNIDRNELEGARWVERAEVVEMLLRRHRERIFTPPPVAIAHHLIRAFIEGGAKVFD